MRVGVVGINHKLADLKLRECLAKVCQRRFGTGKSTHGQHHFVLLSTCNRTEVYFSSEDLVSTHTYLLRILRQEIEEEFDHKLYSYFGYDCFLHLSRVSAGLDSAIIAETEIQGQVKVAYEHSLEYYLLPSDLHYLFQKSLHIGKKVRSELSIKPSMPGLEEGILNTGLNLFKNLSQIRILFLGASEINRKILVFFKKQNLEHISICNRSPEYVKEIAGTHNVAILDWSQIGYWPNYDWIICGTKSPDYILIHDHVPSSMLANKLIIDLSVPRNVQPTLSQDPRITLLNIDQINHALKIRGQCMNHILIKAEAMVMSAVKKQMAIFREKLNNPFRILALG